MKKIGSVILRSPTKIVELRDKEVVFGKIEELTSRETFSQGVSVAKVILWGPDFIHFHNKTEETYICLAGQGVIFLDSRTEPFVPGTRVIIRPKSRHAARPEGKELVFLCVSSPAFSPDDEFRESEDRSWK